MLLTDEEIKKVSDTAFDVLQGMPDYQVNGETWDYVFARAIEQAVLEKIKAQGAEAYIEHHKGGDNLSWDIPRYSSTPLYKLPE